MPLPAALLKKLAKRGIVNTDKGKSLTMQYYNY